MEFMAETYVVNGAKVSCNMGEIEAPLRTTPGRNVKLRGKDRAIQQNVYHW